MCYVYRVKLMSLGKITTLLIMLGLVGFVGVHMITLIAPPALELFSPPQGLTTSSHVIELRGKASPGAQVEINGTSLPPTNAGLFRHELTVNDGINTIMVKARKRYSKERLIERQVFILGENKISKAVGGGI